MSIYHTVLIIFNGNFYVGSSKEYSSCHFSYEWLWVSLAPTFLLVLSISCWGFTYSSSVLLRHVLDNHGSGFVLLNLPISTAKLCLAKTAFLGSSEPCVKSYLIVVLTWAFLNMLNTFSYTCWLFITHCKKGSFLFLIMRIYIYVSVDAHRCQISWSWELQEIMSCHVTVGK